jgi:hypothetical protein
LPVDGRDKRDRYFLFLEQDALVSARNHDLALVELGDVGIAGHLPVLHEHGLFRIGEVVKIRGTVPKG